MRERSTGYPATAGFGGTAMPNGTLEITIPVIDGRRDISRAEALAEDLAASISAHGVASLDSLLAAGWQLEELQHLLPEGLRHLAEARERAVALMDRASVAACIAGFLACMGWLATALPADLTVPGV